MKQLSHVSVTKQTVFWGGGTGGEFMHPKARWDQIEALDQPVYDRNQSFHPSQTLKSNVKSLKVHGSHHYLRHPPTERQDTNSKKLTIGKLSKSGLRRHTKFGQAHSNDEQKNNTFIDFAFHIEFPELIWVTSSAENIDLARKRKLESK